MFGVPSHDSPDRIIFVHIPKAAGRTINSIAVRQYARGEVLQITGGLGEARVPNPQQLAGVKLIVGHVFYGLHRELPGRSSYFTMLRDPVERVLSLYRYIVSTREHPLHGQVAEGGLVRFVSSDANEIENVQTRQIAGDSDGPADARTLTAAKHNLTDQFAAFGIVERFDESVVLFRRKLGWRTPFYVRKNVTENGAADESTADAIQAIRCRNAFDVDLYRYACVLFNERVRSEGPFFDVELTAFRLLNPAAAVYNRWRKRARAPSRP